MKAAVLEKLNSPLVIRDLELSGLEFGQVLVRVLVSGICGSQLHEIAGHKGNKKFLPHLMGHEGCGIVESLGPDVTKFKIGDKVVMHWRQSSGIESDFPKYFLDGKQFSSGKINTITEKAICSENRLTKVPEETPNDLAALLGCSMSTAFGIINNEIDLKIGESVLVIGAGGLGLNLIQAARISGAGKIEALDKDGDKEILSRSMGANSYSISINKILDKYDIVIDTTGNTKVISEAFTKLSNLGRLVLVGQPKPKEHIILKEALSFFNGSGLTIKATQGGKSNPDTDIPTHLNLYRSGVLDYKKLITHRFSLVSINQAFDLLKTGKAGRIMIDLN
jgi:S-(hydroxymethyl)glutathione dehydrogenase/alcohol dehydrogenase